MPYCAECGEPIRSRNQRCWETGGTCAPEGGGFRGGSRGSWRSRRSAPAEIPPDFVRIDTDRDTYAVRERLKARGCKWDNEDKCWLRPPTVNVDDVLASAPVRRAGDAAPGRAKPADLSTWRRVAGNTYAVREQLRALGGWWDADVRGWYLPADKYAEGQAIADGARSRRVQPQPA